jgi:uncharacterized membrane protein HdeD (DUF308 family)
VYSNVFSSLGLAFALQGHRIWLKTIAQESKGNTREGRHDRRCENSHFGQNPGSNPKFTIGEKAMSSVTDVIIQVSPEMIHHWAWFLAFGIVLMVLGIAAVARSVSSTVVSMMFFGWVLLIAGITEFVEAFMVGRWAGFFEHLLIAILCVVIGVTFLRTPSISAEAATLVMSMFFLIAGVYQLISALWTHLPGYGWHVANGVITTVLGGLLLAQWPVSGLYAIGLFVGIDLIFYGWVWMALALGLRKM